MRPVFTASEPAHDAVLAARLQSVCDEGWLMFEAFDSSVRDHRFHPFVAADYERVRDALVAVRSPGARFLEWGSATGVITILASVLGFDAFGIEIDHQLVQAARAFNTRVGASAQFTCGSFVPTGYRWPGHTSEHGETTGTGDSGYLQLGMALDDFDVVFGYPWAGEAAVMRNLMQRHGRRDALLLLHDTSTGVHVYRGGHA
jgi:hypothetical protein